MCDHLHLRVAFEGHGSFPPRRLETRHSQRGLLCDLLGVRTMNTCAEFSAEFSTEFKGEFLIERRRCTGRIYVSDNSVARSIPVIWKSISANRKRNIMRAESEMNDPTT
jgi:hypothetical protein